MNFECCKNCINYDELKRDNTPICRLFLDWKEECEDFRKSLLVLTWDESSICEMYQRREENEF